jgi:hypothetical protein
MYRRKGVSNCNVEEYAEQKTATRRTFCPEDGRVPPKHWAFSELHDVITEYEVCAVKLTSVDAIHTHNEPTIGIWR